MTDQEKIEIYEAYLQVFSKCPSEMEFVGESGKIYSISVALLARQALEQAAK